MSLSKTYTQEELKQILENHLHWWNEDCDGWEAMRADLSRADLSRADLYGADLSRADLSGANLSRADLSRADLYGADLSGAKNIPFVPFACPSDGAFVGWKKAYTSEGDSLLVKLLIPEDAERSSATTNKCRCDKAQVLAITDLDEHTEYPGAVSGHDTDFHYVNGSMVSVDNFDENRWNECSAGIHFFINKQEAVNW